MTRYDDREEINKIIQIYVVPIIAKLNDEPGENSLRYGVKSLKKGASEVRKLKLSSEDRRHISLVHSTFSNAIQALEAGLNGNEVAFYRKRKEFVTQAIEYSRRWGEIQ